MKAKKLKIFLALLLVFLTGLIILMNITITSPRLRDMATARLGKALERQVRVGELRINLRRGVEIRELSVENHKDFSPGAFAQVKNLVVRYKLLPLLRGRLVIGKVALIEPRILLERDGEGNWNFSDFLALGEKRTPSPRSQPSPRKKIPFSVSRITVTGGKIDFRDGKISSPPTETKLENLNLNISSFSLPSPFSFRLTGTLREKEPVTFTLKGKLNLFPDSGLDVNLIVDNLALSRYQPYLREYIPLQDLDGKSNLNLSCRISKEKDLYLTGKIDGEDISLKILPQPADREFPLRQVDELNLSLDIKLTGKLARPPEVTEWEGNLNIHRGKVNLARLREPIDSIKGTMKFEKDKVLISQMRLNLGDSTLEVRGEVNDFKNPQFDLSISSSIKAEEVKNLVPDEWEDRLAGIRLSGTVSSRHRLKGALDNSSIANSINLEDISLNAPQLSLSNISGSFNFNGGNLSLNKPKEMLTEWKGEGEIKVAQGSFKEKEFNDLSALLSLLDGDVKLRELRGSLYGGALKGEGYLNLPLQFYSFRADWKDVDMARLLSSKDGAPVALSGKMKGQASFTGEELSPGAISGKGELKIGKGKIVGMPLMKLLVSLLGIPSLAEIDFQEIYTDFLIENKTVKTGNFQLLSRDVDMFAKGAFDFDTNLDYELTIRLSPEVSAGFFLKMKQLQDDKGRTIIKAKVTGTFEHPKVDLWEAQREQIIKKGLEDLLQEIFK